MAEENLDVRLAGWKALLVVPVIIVVLVIRVISMSDMRNDAGLMKEVKFQLQTEYLPADAARISSLRDSGDTNEQEEAVQSLLTTAINIRSMKGSSPLLHFSTKDTDVVVKVVYSIDDAHGVRKEGTKYYRFRHSMFNDWRYLHDTTALAYYLNFR